MGLVGRFGIRSHDGRWPTNLSTGLKFHQPQADEGLYEVARWATRNKFPRGAFDDSEFSNDPEDWWTSHEDFRPGDRLEGVFGTLRFSSRKKRVHFAAYYQTDIGGLSEEILDVAGLLWLSVGCLPSRDGKVFCLDDVQLPVEAAEDEEEGDPQLTAEHEYNIGVQSRIPRDRIDENPFARGLRRTRPSRGSDVRRDIDPAAERLDSGALNLASSLAVPRRFHFTPTNHQHNDGIGHLRDIEIAVGARTQSTVMYALTEIAESSATAKETELLKRDVNRVFVSCNHPWIRLDQQRSEERRRQTYPKANIPTFFLMRGDAQLLARTMLELPICSQGYLMAQCLTSQCMTMLLAASGLLQPIMVSLILNADRIEPHLAFPQGFTDLFSKILVFMRDGTYRRVFAAAIYELDCKLDRLAEEPHDIRTLVQVAVVTSPEIRDIVSQSIRNLESCLPVKIVLDKSAATLNLVTVLGLTKRFPLEVDVLLESPQAFRKEQQAELPYIQFLLLVLKASLKSLFMRTSLDSGPLFAEVLRSDEVLEMD